MKSSFFLSLVFLWGCASNGTASTPIQEAEPSPQSGLAQMQQSAQELVVILCSSAKVTQAKQLFLQHKVSLVKQSSPTIFTISWSDVRSVKQVTQVLQASKAVFCGIESNQTYTSK